MGWLHFKSIAREKIMFWGQRSFAKDFRFFISKVKVHRFIPKASLYQAGVQIKRSWTTPSLYLAGTRSKIHDLMSYKS